MNPFSCKKIIIGHKNHICTIIHTIPIIVKIWPDLKLFVSTQTLLLSGYFRSDGFIQLCCVSRQHCLFWELKKQASSLEARSQTDQCFTPQLVLQVKDLTPRSSILYIGLENPSACLLTAADSLLSLLPILTSYFCNKYLFSSNHFMVSTVYWRYCDSKRALRAFNLFIVFSFKVVLHIFCW